MNTLLALIFGLTLTLDAPAGCEIDDIKMTPVPPHSIRVMQVEQCGMVVCWTRYVLVENKRRGYSRVCESYSSSDHLVVPSSPKSALP